MTTAQLPTDHQLQARIAHSNMIQGVIGRIAGYSAAVKNFNLTIAAALIAVAFDKDLPMLLVAGVAVTVVFCLLDAYYLSLEKCFRELYGDVTTRDWALALDLSIKQRGVKAADAFKAMTSVSVFGFYVPLLVGLSVLAYISCHDQRAAPETSRPRPPSVAGTGPAKPDPQHAPGPSAAVQSAAPAGKAAVAEPVGDAAGKPAN